MLTCRGVLAQFFEAGDVGQNGCQTIGFDKGLAFVFVWQIGVVALSPDESDFDVFVLMCCPKFGPSAYGVWCYQGGFVCYTKVGVGVLVGSVDGLCVGPKVADRYA